MRSLSSVLKTRRETCNSPAGTWTSINIGSASSFSANSVYYHNGYWVIVGSYYGATEGYYCVGENPSGTWTKINIGTGYGGLKRVYHNGDYWIATATNGSLIYILGDDPSGVWSVSLYIVGGLYATHHSDTHSTYAISSGLSRYKVGKDPTNATISAANVAPNTLYDVYFYDGYWVGAGAHSIGMYYKNSSDPSGPWAFAGGGLSSANVVLSNESYWISAGYHISGNNIIYISGSNPVGTWSSISSGFTSSIHQLAYNCGYMAVAAEGGNMSYCIGMNPSSGWSTISSGTTNALYGIHSNGRYWVVVGYNSTVRYTGS